MILGDNKTDFRSTSTAHFENRYTDSSVPDQIKRVGSHISLGGDSVNYQTSYTNQNDQPRTLTKQGASVNLKEISLSHFKLGNDNVVYKSNSTATIGGTYDIIKQQGDVRTLPIRPSGTAISLGQDRNMYQTS